MNYRKAVLLDDKTETASGTEIIDIDTTSPISRITISWAEVNGSNTPTAHPLAGIKRVQLVDGSTVLCDLTGYEAAALSFYQGHGYPEDLLDYRNTIQAKTDVSLWFGTKLWDDNLAFDPKKFSNPQLKIQHDYSLGGSAPSSAIMSVYADMYDDKTITPAGMLQATELNSTLLVNSAKTPITFPTDYALRMMMVQSLSAGKQPQDQFNHLKFQYNAGGKIIFDMQTTDLMHMLLSDFGQVKSSIKGVATTGAVPFYIPQTFDMRAGFAAIAGAGAYFGQNDDYGGVINVTGSSAASFAANILGYCPHGAVAVPMGQMDNPSDWFTLQGIKGLELDITAGSSVGTTSYVNTVLQQYRTY